jgi:heme A synthase
LNTRLNRVANRRIAQLATRETEESTAGYLEAHVALTRRAKLLSKAIKNAVVSGIFTTCVVIVSFISAAFGLNHAYGAALLFVLALVFFAASLGCLWLEVRTAIGGPDTFL